MQFSSAHSLNVQVQTSSPLKKKKWLNNAIFDRCALSTLLTIGEERPLGEAELVAVFRLAGIDGPGVSEKATQADSVTADPSGRERRVIGRDGGGSRHLPTGAG